MNIGELTVHVREKKNYTLSGRQKYNMALPVVTSNASIIWEMPMHLFDYYLGILKGQLINDIKQRKNIVFFSADNTISVENEYLILFLQIYIMHIIKT